jgi:hypothetical protein
VSPVSHPEQDKASPWGVIKELRLDCLSTKRQIDEIQTLKELLKKLSFDLKLEEKVRKT